MKPGVRFVQATIESIDPGDQAGRDRRRTVRRRHPGGRPRRRPRSRRPRPAWSRAATSSTRWRARSPLRDVLADVRRRPGDRRRHLDPVQVPAGTERDRAADARLPHRPRSAAIAPRSSLVMPLGVPIPPSPAASEALLAAFAERGIELAPRDGWSAGSTPTARSRCSSDGGEMPYDLFLGVPVHRVPPVVDGVGADRRRLDPGRTRSPSRRPSPTCTPSATSPASARRRPASSPRARPPWWPSAIGARMRGDADAAGYDGHGMCYLEFGNDQVAKVDVTFLSGQTPRRRARRTVPGARRRQGRLRHQPCRALVRARPRPRRRALALSGGADGWASAVPSPGESSSTEPHAA